MNYIYVHKREGGNDLGEGGMVWGRGGAVGLFRVLSYNFHLIFATLHVDISVQRPLIEKFKKRDCHYFALIRLFSQ